MKPSATTPAHIGKFSSMSFWFFIPEMIEHIQCCNLQAIVQKMKKY